MCNSAKGMDSNPRLDIGIPLRDDYGDALLESVNRVLLTELPGLKFALFRTEDGNLRATIDFRRMVRYSPRLEEAGVRPMMTQWLGTPEDRYVARVTATLVPNVLWAVLAEVTHASRMRPEMVGRELARLLQALATETEGLIRRAHVIIGPKRCRRRQRRP